MWSDYKKLKNSQNFSPHIHFSALSQIVYSYLFFYIAFMGEWITKKGEADPHPKGPAITKAGLKVEILNVCNCTSDSLHYEVKDERGGSSFYQHPQLIPVKL